MKVRKRSRRKTTSANERICSQSVGPGKKLSPYLHTTHSYRTSHISQIKMQILQFINPNSSTSSKPPETQAYSRPPSLKSRKLTAYIALGGGVRGLGGLRSGGGPSGYEGPNVGDRGSGGRGISLQNTSDGRK